MPKPLVSRFFISPETWGVSPLEGKVLPLLALLTRVSGLISVSCVPTLLIEGGIHSQDCWWYFVEEKPTYGKFLGKYIFTNGTHLCNQLPSQESQQFSTPKAPSSFPNSEPLRTATSLISNRRLWLCLESYFVWVESYSSKDFGYDFSHGL